MTIGVLKSCEIRIHEFSKFWVSGYLISRVFEPLTSRVAEILRFWNREIEFLGFLNWHLSEVQSFWVLDCFMPKVPNACVFEVFMFSRSKFYKLQNFKVAGIQGFWNYVLLVVWVPKFIDFSMCSSRWVLDNLGFKVFAFLNYCISKFFQLRKLEIRGLELLGTC